jgi:translation elongation factor EF-G
MTELKQVFMVDGKTFESRAEAQDYIRRPKIEAALTSVTKGNADLNKWLVENHEGVEMAFEVGTIKRVTNSERKKLEKALEHIAEKLAGDSKASFVTDNKGAIMESFRWPAVKRMSEEEKAQAARNSLLGLTENDEKLVDFILANKEAILTAYDAGIEKRAVNPKAQEALAAYRAKKAAEKAAAEGAAQ